MADTTRTMVVKWTGDTSSLEKSAQTAEKKVGKFGGALSKVGGIAAGAFAGGAALQGAQALVGFLSDSTQAAMEDEQAQAQLAKALQNTAGATDKQIASAEDWISAQGKALGVADDQLRPALASLARATGDVGDAQQWAATAMDVSAGTGKDLESVSTALAKVANGNFGALKKLGIAYDENRAKTEGAAYAQELLNEKFGGQAQTAANTTAGKMQRLQLQFGEMKEELGAKLLPVITTLMDFLMNDLPRAISIAVDWIKENWPKVQEYVQPVIDFVVKPFGNLQQIVGGVIEVFQGLVDFFAGVFTGDWSRAWEGIKKITHGFFNIISGYVQNFIDYITLLFAYPWKVIQAAWDAGLAVVKQLVEWYIGFYKMLIEGFISFLKFIFTGAWDGLKNALTAAWDWVVAFITDLPNKAVWLLTKATEFGSKIGGAIKDAITGAVTGIADALKSVVSAAMNVVIDAWNRIDLGIHISVPSWVPGVGGKGFDIDDVFPDVSRVHLATGGLTKAEGLAYLHPNEVVAPLERIGGIGTTVYNINVNVAPTANVADVGRSIVEAVRAYEQRNGASWRAS